MSTLPRRLPIDQVRSLTPDQIKAAYRSRLASWARGAGFGKNIRLLLDDPATTTLDEFTDDIMTGKAPVWTHDVPDLVSQEVAA